MANGNVLSLLDSAARAQAPIDGVSLLSAASPVDPAEFTRADGLRVRIDFQAAATAAQRTNASNAVLAADLTNATRDAARAAAKAILARATQDEADLLRAVALAARAGDNQIRARQRAQDAAVAGAVSLADLKARWASAAAANPMPDLSKGDVLAAITGLLDDGSADS